MAREQYDAQFFAEYENESARSAKAVVPFICKLFRPSSVVDVGCGVGAWLRAFQESDVEDVLGIDGDYVDRSQLHVDASCFRAHDLTQPMAPGDHDNRRFDLALSLEVAEHLDEQYGQVFVGTLASLADVVVFSAAIPHQGGTDHLNEQWPNYWAKLFAAAGYGTYDCIRPRLWDNPDVAYYYSQNTLVYIKQESADRYPQVAGFQVNPADLNLSRVHPVKWEAAHDPARIRLRSLLQALPGSVRAAVRRRVQR